MLVPIACLLRCYIASRTLRDLQVSAPTLPPLSTPFDRNEFEEFISCHLKNLSIYLSINLFTYLFIDLSIYMYTNSFIYVYSLLYSIFAKQHQHL
jgi:hypothetical protein